MPGLYDQIESQLDDEEPEARKPFFDRLSKQLDDRVEGIKVTDLISLTGAQKTVMMFLLRDNEAATQGITLSDLRQSLPDIAEALPRALTELTQQGWLIASGEAPLIRYRVHMRRKRGSELGLGIWSSLFRAKR
jgi:hypothetical protein